MYQKVNLCDFLPLCLSNYFKTNKSIDMKFFKFFFIAFAVFGLTACSNDDDSSIELTNENIVGDYEIILYQGLREETETASNGTEVLIETETFTTDTFTNTSFIFNDDGTYLISANYRITYSLTVTGQSPETNSEIRNTNYDDTFFIGDNGSIIIGDIGYDVQFFDGTNLYLTTTNSTENFDDTNSTNLYDIELRLRKRE